jgi:hypothetical protein
MKWFAAYLVTHGATTDELLIAADSIRDKRKKALFIKHLQMQIGTRQELLPNESESSRNRPPRSAQFALLLIPRRNREHLVGDLEEEFRTVVLPQHGYFLARFWYFEQVALAIACYTRPTIKKLLGLSVILKLIGR